jgi:VWFA-related protein
MTTGRFLVVSAIVVLSAMPSAAALPAQFRTTSDLVVLNVRVTDDDGAHVPHLTAQQFTVFDNGRPQPVSVFASENAPVTVGLIVDSSVSMWAIKARLIAGARSFAAASHPENELFAFAFNDWPTSALPAESPFTSDPDRLADALTEVVQPRGRTALFDAIAAGLEYAARGRHPRQVLVVMSDGGDNASTATFDQVAARTQTSNVVIYGVALVDPLTPGARPEVLRRLARATGGEVFAPKTIGDVREALGHIAEDIKQAYMLGYVPSGTAPGQTHALRVVVSSRVDRDLRVRTRENYRESPEPSDAPQSNP